MFVRRGWARLAPGPGDRSGSEGRAEHEPRGGWWKPGARTTDRTGSTATSARDTLALFGPMAPLGEGDANCAGVKWECVKDDAG